MIGIALLERKKYLHDNAQLCFLCCGRSSRSPSFLQSLSKNYYPLVIPLYRMILKYSQLLIELMN